MALQALGRSHIASYYVLVMPITLVLLKSVVLPALLYACAGTLGASITARDFAFVVGLFPAAGSTWSSAKTLASTSGSNSS